MKLSAFYTRCERACNPWPTAQASGQECVTSLCEFWQVKTPVLLVSFFSEFASLNSFIQGNVASHFRRSVFASSFFCTRKKVTFFLFSGQLLAYLFLGWTFPSLIFSQLIIILLKNQHLYKFLSRSKIIVKLLSWQYTFFYSLLILFKLNFKVSEIF